jgi:hypothetical protein
VHTNNLETFKVKDNRFKVRVGELLQEFRVEKRIFVSDKNAHFIPSVNQHAAKDFYLSIT